MLALSAAQDAPPPRRMEALGRGVVAVHQGGGKVFVGWRLLATDPEDTAFNLYRKTGGGEPVRLNKAPLAASTCFVDAEAKLEQETSYLVRPVVDGRETDPGAPFTLKVGAPARPYLSIPLRTPEGYVPNDASAGDLDGDGEYEIVLHQAGRGRDNSQDGPTDEPILEAYRLDGTFLWRINLGKNIREGAHCTQFMVYDLDGDGKAEVMCKTADGTVDGKGAVIGDAKADHRELRLYTTAIPTEHRLPTLMHDPQYRLGVAWQNVAYNLPAQTGFHLGHGMKPPPRPRIATGREK